MGDPVPEGVPEPPGWRAAMKKKAVGFICDACGIDGGCPYLQKDEFDGRPCMDPECGGTWHVEHGQSEDTDYERVKARKEVMQNA